MEDPFKPSSMSIKALFGDTNSFYKIPRYQRPYKWENEQVDQLWDDISEAFQNKVPNYFLGSIITAKPRDDEKSVYMDVVDGQQRLTTLMIMFCVIRDLYPDINARNLDENPFAVDIDSINRSIRVGKTSNRLKLYTHVNAQSDFDGLILKGNTLELKKPYKYQIRIDEEPKYKFINTACIFHEKFKELGKDASEEFINYLFNQVQIIRIDCANRDFAIKLFQVLNDRGMDLTAADMIKSFLLEKLYTKYVDDDPTSKLRENQFISDWRYMEQSIKACDISLNDLFIIYEYHILGQNPKKSLYDELQNAFADEDPNVVIGDIKNFADTYFKDIYDKDDKILFSLKYIRWNMYWKSILLTALHKEYSDYEKLKKQLRRFYYLYWIAGKTLSQIKQTSFNLIKWVKENKPISDIEDELNKKLKNDGIESIAIRNLTSENIATEPWIKPLLLMMEYNVTDNSKLAFIELNKNLHLEHILPIKYKKFSEWNHITDVTATKWINSAGNITLLSGAKNIEASNNPFNTKMDVYKGKGKYEDKNDKITAFLTTQSLVKNYDDGKYGGLWNLETMSDRWKWFFSEIEEMLEIDVTQAVEQEPELV